MPDEQQSQGEVANEVDHDAIRHYFEIDADSLPKERIDAAIASIHGRISSIMFMEKVTDRPNEFVDVMHLPGGTRTVKFRKNADFNQTRSVLKRIIDPNEKLFSDPVRQKVMEAITDESRRMAKQENAVIESEGDNSTPEAVSADSSTPAGGAVSADSTSSSAASSDASASTENPADTGSSASTAADASATPAATAPAPGAGRRFLNWIKNVPNDIRESYRYTIVDDINATRKEILEQQIDVSAKALENIKNERTRLSDEQKIIDQLEKNMKEIRDYKEEQRQKSPLYRFGKYIWSYAPAVRLRSRLEKSEAKAEDVETKLKWKSDKKKMKKKIAENKKLVASYKKEKWDDYKAYAAAPFKYVYGKVVSGASSAIETVVLKPTKAVVDNVVKKPISKLWSALDIINPGSDKFWLYSPDSNKK